MLSVNFANPTSGTLAASIGWFDFTGLNLSPNTSTILSNSIPNGGLISFKLTNIGISGNVSFSGHVSPQRAGMPFGTVGYTGIAGEPLLNALNVMGGQALLTISNLSVTNNIGATIPFGLVVAEAEGQVGAEYFTATTNGSPWKLIANLSGSTSNISGIGTNTVTWGNANPWPSPVISSNTPTSISVYDIEYSQSAIALGVVLTPITMKKNVVNRISSLDQFVLSITGPQSASTITSGTTTGLQANQATLYAQNGGVYILTESLAAGSSSSLTQYAQSVSIVNSAQGGTTIPANWQLGTPLTLAMGDNINVIVTNTPINPTITSLKTVDKRFATTGDILTYTIALTNTYPSVATNAVLIDTTPNGTTFIPSSLTLNNVSISGNPNPPSGLSLFTLPANAITTVSFQVSVDATIPIITSLKNVATTSYSYLVVSNTPPSLRTTSNTVTTTISSTNLSSIKSVNKQYSTLGDTLTYTVVIKNNGNTTASNILFVDSLPTGTSFIPNSFTQNATTISGDPNPPGITLPNAIGIGVTSTLTFQASVTTLPPANLISNSGIINYTFILDPSSSTTISGAQSTNVASTTINYASLGHITKSVDYHYAICGDTLTYTIAIPNTGNTTAFNVVFTDTLPPDTVYIPGSLTLNGVTLAGFPTNISIGTLAVGSISTITFQVQINC